MGRNGKYDATLNCLVNSDSHNFGNIAPGSARHQQPGIISQSALPPGRAGAWRSRNSREHHFPNCLFICVNHYMCRVYGKMVVFPTKCRGEIYRAQQTPSLPR